MTPEAQRIAIAEACGWRIAERVLPELKEEAIYCWIQPNGNEWQEQILPNYTEDLNAMHEAEKVLNQEQKEDYFFIIFNFYGNWPKAIQATAAQRARAFLRVIGKWESE